MASIQRCAHADARLKILPFWQPLVHFRTKIEAELDRNVMIRFLEPVDSAICAFANVNVVNKDIEALERNCKPEQATNGSYTPLGISRSTMAQTTFGLILRDLSASGCGLMLLSLILNGLKSLKFLLALLPPRKPLVLLAARQVLNSVDDVH